MNISILDLSWAGMAVYPDGSTFGPRTLRDHELVWIVDGDADWMVDGVTHRAPAGTVLLARPGMTDAFRWHGTRHAYVHCVVRGRLDPPLVRTLVPDDVIPPLFRHLLWLHDARPPGWEPLARSAVRHMLLAFASGAMRTAPDVETGFPPPVERALAYVRERWAREMRSPSLDELARAAAVTPSHLSRAFAKATGYGPAEALRRVRLDRAATLLLRSNMSVQEIARLTGFANQFHFSRRFSNVYGTSPRAFRAAGDPPQRHEPLRRLVARST